MLDYDQARGYIHTTTGLRWSYGAMKGRPQDWAAETETLSTSTLVRGLVAAGFDGIWIDRYGCADRGAAVEQGLQSVLGERPIVSRDQRHSFFNLLPFAARFEARESSYAIGGLSQAMLYPPEVTWGYGFYADEGDGSRWSLPAATAQIANTSTVTKRLILDTSILTLGHGRYPLTVTFPDGTVRHLIIGQTPEGVSIIFNDPPGTHTLTFKSTAPIVPVPSDTRPLAVRYNDLQVADATIAPFLGSGGG
jgi:phosphoglycerol transferase